MVNTRLSSGVATDTLLVLGKATSTPCTSIGAVTMKIIRSTSMTSTRGVTLISAIRRPGFLLFSTSIGFCPQRLGENISFHNVQKIADEAIQIHGETIEP